MTKYEFDEKLIKIKNDTSRTNLQRNVAELLIEESKGWNDIKYFFRELWKLKGANDLINGLVLYKDSYNKFAKNNYQDLKELMEETAKEIDIDNLNINELAWFGFEVVAGDIEQEVVYGNKKRN